MSLGRAQGHLDRGGLKPWPRRGGCCSLRLIEVDVSVEVALPVVWRADAGLLDLLRTQSDLPELDLVDVALEALTNLERVGVRVCVDAPLGLEGRGPNLNSISVQGELGARVGDGNVVPPLAFQSQGWRGRCPVLAKRSVDGNGQGVVRWVKGHSVALGGPALRRGLRQQECLIPRAQAGIHPKVDGHFLVGNVQVEGSGLGEHDRVRTRKLLGVTLAHVKADVLRVGDL